MRTSFSEDRRVLAAAFAEFIDPHPVDGNRFGDILVALSTGNVVITAPFDDAVGCGRRCGLSV